MNTFIAEPMDETDENGHVAITDEPVSECPVCGADVDYSYRQSYVGDYENNYTEHKGSCSNGHSITSYGELTSREDEEEEMVGQVFADEQTGDRLFVTSVTDELADEYVVTYDYKQDEVTVNDFDGNSEYPDDDVVVEAEYVSDREEYEEVKTYAFPKSRVVSTDEVVPEPADSEASADSDFVFDESELGKSATSEADDDEEDELSQDEFFVRHYFRGRSRGDRVPRRMGDYTLVTRSESTEDTLDLMYDDGDELVRITRDEDDKYQVLIRRPDEDTEEFLARHGSSSDAIDAAVDYMAAGGSL